MKIPLTQLRFEKNTDYVWGMEVFRVSYRESEMSFWQPIPRNTSGLVHMYGELDGLDNIEPKKTFDLTPYAVASCENYKAQPGNSFLTGKDFIPDAGLDGKIGVTNNLTLDFTVNPDFGQVEADPSELNLTAYESFFSETDSDLQYVNALQNEEGEISYVFADLAQHVLSLSLRVNFNITPDLTIQYWGQPFFAAADYSGYKKISNPVAGTCYDRYHEFIENEIVNLENVYYVDEDTDGHTDYSFGNPDFNFDEFLSNLVVRWEFVPVSTLYAVWSQTRDAYIPTGEFVIRDNINTLFTGEKPYNVFLLKFSYRFGLR